MIGPGQVIFSTTGAVQKRGQWLKIPLVGSRPDKKIFIPSIVGFKDICSNTKRIVDARLWLPISN